VHAGRGAKKAQTPRLMGESFVDGCARGAVGQLERMVEWNRIDVNFHVEATGHCGITAAAEAGQLAAVQFLVEKVRGCPRVYAVSRGKQSSLLIRDCSGHGSI
jgi:hypothetical protein